MKTSKRKIGTLNIRNGDLYYTTLKKPIWMWIEDDYWLKDKKNYVLNINFKPDESDMMHMLCGRLVTNNIHPEINRVEINVDTGNDMTYRKKYYKVFINLDANDDELKRILNILQEKTHRSVTTFKSEIDEPKIEKFKLEAIAEMI